MDGMTTLNPEERVLATARHIMMTLGDDVNIKDDMMSILSKFDDRFSSLPRSERGAAPQRQDEEDEPECGASTSASLSATRRASLDELDSAEETILKWKDESLQKTIWGGPEEDVASYLQAVDDVQIILDGLSVSESKDGLDRAQNLLEMGMIRLQEEFRHILEINSAPVPPEELLESVAISTIPSFSRENTFGSRPDPEDADVSDPVAAASSDDEEEEDVPTAEPVSDLNPIIDTLLPPEVVQDLHDIAKRMVQSQYTRECCQVYGSIRKIILEESLQSLGAEKLSIEEVQKMQWDVLEGKIKKWIQAMNAGVKVLFATERELCKRVFEDLGDVEENCFADFARGSMMQLLNFGEAIAISRRALEKLFRILDMYEALRDLLPEICEIFSGETCAGVRNEASGILLRLGEAARGTFSEFENAIYKDASRTPVPGGALHPLTRYVMNYLSFLFVYVNTLRQLFENSGSEDSNGLEDQTPEDESQGENKKSLLAQQMVWIIDVLVANLDTKSKLYKDPALTHLFLMNNVHYIVQKVKQTEIRPLLGDDWIRRHALQVRQHATHYQRVAWNKILSFLKDEGIRIGGSFSSGVSKTVLKERFKSFNATFEEIHRTQSLWHVPDSQLRLELRISISEKLLPAYRAFLGRNRIYLDSERHPERYIKYTPEDLEGYMNDLFEGASISGTRPR